MHQPIQDTIGDSGIADLLVPLRHRSLRGENGGTGLVAFLADFPEVAAFRLLQRRHCPTVYHQHIDPRQAGQQVAKTAISPRQRQIAKQRRGWRTEHQKAVAAGLLRQGTCQEAFPNASWANQENILVPLRPAGIGGQRAQHVAVQTAGQALVDVDLGRPPHGCHLERFGGQRLRRRTVQFQEQALPAALARFEGPLIQLVQKLASRAV